LSQEKLAAKWIQLIDQFDVFVKAEIMTVQKKARSCWLPSVQFSKTVN
jgi:hypothetical protein